MTDAVFRHFALPVPDELEHYIGREKGKCIVCGTGHTMWNDMLAAGYSPSIDNLSSGDKRQGFDIIAVNRAVMDIPSKVKYAYSGHQTLLRTWYQGIDQTHQDRKKHETPTELHGCHGSGDWYVRWPWGNRGTSSIGAVYLAITLGYEDIKVCGVPMDDGPHYYDPPWLKTNFDNKHIFRAWQNAFDKIFEGKVELISGVLKERLERGW